MGPATSTPMLNASVTTMASPSRRWATRRLSTNRSVAIRNVYGTSGPQGRPARPRSPYRPAGSTGRAGRRRPGGRSRGCLEPDAPERGHGLPGERRRSGSRRQRHQDRRGPHADQPERGVLVREEGKVLAAERDLELPRTVDDRQPVRGQPRERGTARAGDMDARLRHDATELGGRYRGAAGREGLEAEEPVLAPDPHATAGLAEGSPLGRHRDVDGERGTEDLGPVGADLQESPAKRQHRGGRRRGRRGNGGRTGRMEL